MRLRTSFSIFLCFAFIFNGCSSYTIIRSDPEGAKIFVNGEYRGRTPYVHIDDSIIFSKVDIKLEKEGYKTFETSFRRNERFNLAACIAGTFTVVPFLWVMNYTPERTFGLK